MFKASGSRESFWALTAVALLLPAVATPQDRDTSDSQSIDQSAAKLNAAPDAKAAIQSAGMTARDYIVFSWSLVHNGWAAWTSTRGMKPI